VLRVRLLVVFLALGCLPFYSVAGQSAGGPGFDPKPLRIPATDNLGRRPVTNMDLLTIRDVHGLAISHDGAYIAFVAGQAEYESNSYRTGIFVMTTNGGGKPICLGTAGLPDWDEINQWREEPPQWSADDRYVYRRLRLQGDGSWQVWRWDRRGGAPVRVTHVRGDVRTYEFARGGREIVLTVEGKINQKAKVRLREDGIVYDGTFFLTRQHAVVEEKASTEAPQTEIWIHDAKTGHEWKASPREIEEAGPWKSDLQDKFLKTSDTSLEGHRILDAKVSPDGKSVAYRYLPANPAEFGNSVCVLFSKPVRGGTPIVLTAGSYFVRDYQWSADSTTLYYTDVESDGRSPKLMTVKAAGGQARQLFRGEGYYSSCSTDRRAHFAACIRQSASEPGQIALADLVRGSVRTLADLNPEFRRLELGSVDRIEGVNDLGDAWFAYVVKPLNYTPGKRYPTVLTTYRGGDYFLRGASGDESPIQVYAAQGFAVLVFDMGQDREGRLRTGDFAAYLKALSSPVDSMKMAIAKGVELGIVDSERVAVTGFSRGTEQAAYAVTHTDLFRAASGVAGDNGPYTY
jgi:dipeptidyl aminopeptidase/acylaminoacyl peptidase